MMLKLMEMKSNDPRLTQNEISKQLTYSHSTVKRYRDDINMDSPYKRKKYKNTNTESNTSITETHTPSEKT